MKVTGVTTRPCVLLVWVGFIKPRDDVFDRQQQVDSVEVLDFCGCQHEQDGLFTVIVHFLNELSLLSIEQDFIQKAGNGD